MSPGIRVVIVDDSPFVCRLLASYLRADGGFEVVGTALGAAQALRLVADLRPDALTLDLEMPGVNGLEAVAAIMREQPTPIVVISGVSGRAATMTLQALDLGAVDFVLKYSLVAPGGHHLVLRRDARVEVRRGPEIGGHCPSIDVTMQSVAQAVGARARGVVLTGMGGDGTLGLLAIRMGGGRTFAQDAASCVVDGMPQRAIERGVVDHVAPPREIAQLLAAERLAMAAGG